MVRIRAAAWLNIIWHCWQTDTAYDTTQHGDLQRLLADQNKIDSAAA